MFSNKIMYVVGARPNFMKVAPILRAVNQLAPNVEQILVHTGQHFDAIMSDVFFQELGMPEPDEFLGISGGTHAVQTAKIMTAFEPVLEKHLPDWLVVVGDVNSTMACAVVAAKLGIKIAHVEAGLRSGDMSMPEEVNRRLTDVISDILLTPSIDGDENLIREGIDPAKIYRVGNVMIDSLIRVLPTIRTENTLDKFQLKSGQFALVTLHRPSNVDNQDVLMELYAALEEIAQNTQVVFPVHPRTQQRLEKSGLLPGSRVQLMGPLGYLDFLALMKSAYAVITDSGGVQEETTYLQIPCLTVRPNTERPITTTSGSNRLIHPDRDSLLSAWEDIDRQKKTYSIPELWDGNAAERIAHVLVDKLSLSTS